MTESRLPYYHSLKKVFICSSNRTLFKAKAGETQFDLLPCVERPPVGALFARETFMHN